MEKNCQLPVGSRSLLSVAYPAEEVGECKRGQIYFSNHYRIIATMKFARSQINITVTMATIKVEAASPSLPRTFAEIVSVCIFISSFHETCG